ncbi:MAG: sulfoxide reductase heme-binding subunit YedZ [Calditrichota bacterium]
MRQIIKPAAHLGSLIPLGLLIGAVLTHNLSVNPIQDLTLRTGKAALILLVVSLSVTPAKTITGWSWLFPARKICGLYAAFYAFLHFSVFVGLDYFFSWALIKQAIAEKPFVLVGFLAFILLSILAITSTKGWKRRLKKRWKPLHRLVYAVGILAVIHFLWLVKSDIREPAAYGVVIGVLLLLRLPFVRNFIGELRKVEM